MSMLLFLIQLTPLSFLGTKARQDNNGDAPGKPRQHGQEMDRLASTMPVTDVGNEDLTFTALEPLLSP